MPPDFKFEQDVAKTRTDTCTAQTLVGLLWKDGVCGLCELFLFSSQ